MGTSRRRGSSWDGTNTETHHASIRARHLPKNGRPIKKSRHEKRDGGPSVRLCGAVTREPVLLHIALTKKRIVESGQLRVFSAGHIFTRVDDMELIILGTGGFDNPGIPFNSFLIDGHILVESPPDILQSLYSQKRDRNRIDTVLISHTHGDHIFGLPFFLYNVLQHAGTEKKIRIVGPKDTREVVMDLAILAISREHPLCDCIERHCRFETVGEGSRFTVGSYSVETGRMVHPKETYGFGFFKDTIFELQYLPDTKWDAGFLPLFLKKPKLVLCDVGGSGGNSVFHMSVDDLLRNLPGVVDQETRVIGTHLGAGHVEPRGFVAIARPGETYTI